MAENIQTFDLSVDLMRAILWQYNEAVRLQSLITDKQDWYNENQTAFFNDFYTDIFNLKTANYFGLSVWSIILGQPIVFLNIGNPDKENFGFGEFHRNFTRGNFVSNTGFDYFLPPESARILLRLRYYQLTGSGTVPEINRMLKDVFGYYGPAYLQDNQDMTQFYVFGFELNSDLRFLFNNFDILPRPAGVGSSYIVSTIESWGFGDFHQNFDNGNFFEG